MTAAGAAAQPGASATPPPSAVLDYRIQAKQSGLQLDGQATVDWQATPSTFRVTTETRSPLFGKMLETKSEGAIDGRGLAPSLFSEKKLRRKADTVTFDRAAGNLLFSSGKPPQPIEPGMQDRNSVVWQLAALARATPGKVKTGSEWTLPVAGPRGADPWTFRVTGRESVRTPTGTHQAFHIERKPPDERGQQLDLWLAPSIEWYPVKIRFVEEDGDWIEQLLARVTRSGRTGGIQ